MTAAAGGELLLAVEVSAGPLGLLVVVLVAITTVLLIRSMNARLRRLPREYPEVVTPAEDRPADPA